MNVLTILFPILLAAAPAPVDYSADVAPVVQKHCAKCHGADKQESGLRLDRRASLLRGGDFGQPAIEVGNSAASFLIQVVSGKNPDVKMPPEGAPLTDAEIALLKAWIDQGAKMPEELSGDDLPDRGDHWSYQPVQAVAPPDVKSEFVANPIDAFVLQRLKEKGLSPSPPAERRTLIRRLYLVMHGLPPTPEQIEQFLADESPDAWSHAVDRALASPRYGERWARHWLDLIRFGETHGFETNRERPNAWLFRDYVIQSFNADKP
ncbi:MAG: DUF1549 domain-containing protein, partial [Planctomycetales bacterium]|nr:DUF1549 domain-containing protein [Planctomycetales bacterium]